MNTQTVFLSSFSVLKFQQHFINWRWIIWRA